MPQKLNSSIFPLDIIFHTTMISSSKTLNSNLHLSSIFSEFLFLVIFLGKSTFLLFLNKLLRGWVFCGAFVLFFSPPQLLALYRGVVRPCMEYASHILGGSTHTAILEKVESRAFRLINSPALTNFLQSLSSRRIVASLSLYYRYYNGHCSSELSRHIPPPLRRARATRLSTQSHPFSAQLSDPRLNRYVHSYMYSTGKVWNTLPSSVFPTSFDLHTFKRRVSGHVGFHRS